MTHEYQIEKGHLSFTRSLRADLVYTDVMFEHNGQAFNVPVELSVQTVGEDYKDTFLTKLVLNEASFVMNESELREFASRLNILFATNVDVEDYITDLTRR